jgi:hypothetical protein
MLSYEQVHVRNESLSEVGPRDRDVRSTLDCVAKVPKRCANNFRKKANQATIVDRCILKRASEVASELSAIRSSIFLLDCRAYGRKKLSSVTQKDFCNTIPSEADIVR